MLEYFFTKERVTLENQGTEEAAIPFRAQLKAIFTDRYMLIIYAYFLIYTFGTSIKNLSLVYFCNYVLGTYNDGITQTLISVIGGIPMGIGIFAVWPLAKKFGKRNVTLVGFILYAIGSAVCWLFPTNMVIMLVGQFIKNIGGLPCSYHHLGSMGGQHYERQEYCLPEPLLQGRSLRVVDEHHVRYSVGR